MNLKSCLSFLSSLDDKSVLLCLDFSWYHCGECAETRREHPSNSLWCHAASSLLVQALYLVPPFNSIQVFTCFSLKPPRRGELVTAGATSGPALSDPLTGNVGGQLSHLPSFDLNHLIRPFNK